MAPSPPSSPSAASPVPKRAPRPYKRRKAKRKPIRSAAAFVAQHRADEARLRNYHVDARAGSVLLSGAELDRLAPVNALFLDAANPTARISYAQTAAAHLVEMVGALAQSAPVWFVTLIEERFTISLSEAASFDVAALQAWVARRLPGCSYVGMVEAAYFSNVGLLKAGMDRGVCWHVHLFLWGVGERRLDRLIARMNQRYRTLIPGVVPAHARLLRAREVEGQAYYALKAPFSDHRVYEWKRESVDRTTGEVTKVGIGEFRQRKQELRPCDLVRMVKVMDDRTLDQLAFAAGAGTPILGTINRRALAALDRSPDRRIWTGPPAVERPRSTSRSRPGPSIALSRSEEHAMSSRRNTRARLTRCP